jgi:hypothetical protein
VRYGYAMPPGWIRRPNPSPQQGVFLASPPGTPFARLLLMDAIVPDGTLEDQVERSLTQGCAGVQIVERIRAARLPPGPGLPGAAASARVRMPLGIGFREEGRLFALFEGQGERLPVVFLGETTALPFHRAALQGIFESILVLAAEDGSLF